ncbi:YpiF family protein [Bacillus sp. CGMCC 1.16541]|uniref:YpiF family protein n=1 Tax=Bacillus sp. CGMCC 1.16541 TaxID=2185143 RepID=UPI0013A55C31|nr:YpiF family protein [Bacillus sp. CGMCC 1.16541]
MKWFTKDVDMYLQAKDYVDSILLPVIPLDFGSSIKTNASMGEYMTLLTSEIERQFKGRLFLSPSFTYLKEEDLELQKNRLLLWKNNMEENRFKHVFIMTSDSAWKQYENELGESFLWLPSLPLENLDDQYKVKVIQDQVQQMMNLFLEQWKKEK